jgi:tetratricopeptide (TPR) repeat protein
MTKSLEALILKDSGLDYFLAPRNSGMWAMPHIRHIFLALTLPWYRECLEVTQRLLGHEYPDVATSQYNLGTLYQQQGKYSEARALYRQAIAIAQSSLGLNHPNTQTMVERLDSLPEE